MDSITRSICETQGNIFESYARLMSAETFEKFVVFYMTSDFCAREMDASYSWLHLQPALQSMDFIDVEMKKENFVYQEAPEADRINSDVAWWLGFTYRHLAIKNKLPSRSIIQRVRVERLILAYPGLSTVDDDMAAEIISQDFCLNNLRETNKRDDS